MKKIILCVLVWIISGYSFICFACVGARPLSMGGAFVGVADDIHACYWNPAGLGNIQRTEITYMRTLNNCAMINYQYWSAVGIKLGDYGGIGLSYIKAINHYCSVYATNTTTELYAYYTNDDFVTLSLGGWGTGLFGNTAFGINIREYSHALEKRDDFKLLKDGITTREAMGREAKVIGYDLGVLHKMSDNITLGLLVQSINQPRFEFDKYIFVCEVGHVFDEDPNQLCPICKEEGHAGITIEKQKMYRQHARNFRWSIVWKPIQQCIISTEIYCFSVKDVYDRKLQSAVRIGFEQWLTDSIAIRGGILGKEFYTLGFGLKNKPQEGSTAPRLIYQIDYGVLEGSGYGVHVLSVSMKW
jgi:hypothetical protein